MTARLPIKKTVSFQWGGRRLAFDVAQDLFSSFQVDRGSRMLLDSLDVSAFPNAGHAVDFGCGYGVLGIAWQVAKPGWSMAYVDRDALAVAFSRHNAGSNLPDLERASFLTEISVPFRDGGYHLVLWNVPGKAGRPVLTALLDASLDALAPGGLLAAVVVHPLADLFTGGLGRDDAHVVHVDRGKEHTVVHIRRSGGTVVPRDPFAAGAFDRPEATFAAAGLEWSLLPAIGLPEYDALSHATELAARAIVDLRDEPIRSWALVEPGVGHLALVARRCWPDAQGHIFARDALALRVTERTVGASYGIECRAIWGIPELGNAGPVDLAIVALPEQARSEDLADDLGVLSGLVTPAGVLVLHGRSVEAARIERLARAGDRLRAGRTAKLRGSACITARKRA